MNTRSRKKTSQQNDKKPVGKIKKVSKTPDGQVKTPDLKKVSSSSRTDIILRQSIRVSLEPLKISISSNKINQKVEVELENGSKTSEVIDKTPTLKQMSLESPSTNIKASGRSTRSTREALDRNSASSQDQIESIENATDVDENSATCKEVCIPSSPSIGKSRFRVKRTPQETANSGSVPSQTRSEHMANTKPKTRSKTPEWKDKTPTLQQNISSVFPNGKTRSRSTKASQQDGQSSYTSIKEQSKLKRQKKSTSVQEQSKLNGQSSSISVQEQSKLNGQSSSISVQEQSKLNETSKPSDDSKPQNLNDKAPIWKKSDAFSTLFDFKAKRRSTRVSYHKNKDIYEFPWEGGNENGVIKKKRRKPQVKKKKLKPLTKNGMLTTDPLFEPTIAKPISTSAFYAGKKKENAPENKSSDTYEENDFMDHSDNMDSHFDDNTVDDAGYEASISVANDTEQTGLLLGNTALSVLPTPKTTLRFPGTSSTPYVCEDRYDFNPFVSNRVSVPITHEEEVKLCFGFDDSDDAHIGISPVKKSKQLSILHQESMAIFSNVEEIDPVPTRFTTSASFKRPLPLTMDKENARPHIKKRCTSTKENRSKRKKKIQDPNVSDIISVSPSKVCNNKSVLFDEENEDVSTEVNGFKSPSKKVVPNAISKNILKNINNQISPSPEKSFPAPARKSYDRKSLENIRQKFIQEFAGGYPTTDTDTENEETGKNDRITRRKRREKQVQKSVKNAEKPVKKTYPKKKKPKEKENTTPTFDKNKKKNDKNKKRNETMDKTVVDWASDINSHFSEIEDVDLVIE